ncbi:MAG: shikimate kinase [Leptolyngbya sp. SIO3F4]|nr:shikimate kinase [Leptolyngbya sp. SIO3F4]
MGSGKTTVGKKLARLLGAAHLDMDALVEQHSGRSISDWFAQEGEWAFRLAERDALHRTAQEERVVVSTGGGAPCFFDNMDWINAHGTSVYLHLEAAALVARLRQSKEPRPLLASIRTEWWEPWIAGKLEEREPFYRQAAHTVSGHSVDVAALAEKLRPLL